MKKILLVLTVVLSAFAASAQKSAAVSAESLTKGKTSGVYTFTLPADVTSAKVNEVKNYYTQYFTVNFDEGKHIATVKMADASEKSKRVIQRLMISLDVKTFKVDEKEYTFEELFNQYMK